MSDKIHSWAQALTENALSPDQLAVLQKMVDDHEAENLQEAAARLDWQDHIIHPDEHMYGF